MSRLMDTVDGIETWFDFDETTNKQTITYRQDCTAFLETMNQKRISNEWAKEVKQDWVHCAKIPSGVELQLRAKGIKLEDKNCTKKLMKEIQENYPYLMSHGGKRFA
jgi:hypothetical protein